MRNHCSFIKKFLKLRLKKFFENHVSIHDYVYVNIEIVKNKIIVAIKKIASKTF